MQSYIAVQNLVLGETNDLWRVNTDQEYHEEIKAAAESKPGELQEIVEDALASIFNKIDRVAMGLSVAVGTVAGVFLALVTLVLVAKGVETVGPNFQQLGQYFLGYSVTIQGSLLGVAYGFVSGFVGGWGSLF